VTAYVIARVAVHDRTPCDRYAAAFLPVLRRYGGRLLSADEAPESMDGDDTRKVVLLAFDTAEAARAWAASPEYQAIARDRDAGADVEAVLAQGVG
jgi:uncharacterized protein (DUF1330 family)